MLPIKELFPQEELIVMENYITEFAFEENPKNVHRVPIEKILEVWGNKKIPLFEIFGEQLILTKEVEFKRSVEMLEDDINDVIFRYDAPEPLPFVQAFSDLTRYEGPFAADWDIERLMTTYALASNRWEHRDFTINFPNGKNPIRVMRGAKISKVLGKIAKALDMPGYEEFRIAHSQVLNQKKLTGQLCMSIHPLDFMTMSDNDSGWTSCMNWSDWGEYRQGTVEMMNSPMVVCVYLAGHTPMTLYGQEWSNKKWRQLFIVNEDVICGVKGYPYQNDELTKIALEWLRELATANKGWEYNNKLFHFGLCENIKFNETTCNLNFHTNNMYNDFNDNHWGYVRPTLNESLTITYSGPSQCMCCGDIEPDLEGESYLVCQECEETYHCSECGERHSYDSLIEVNGNLYCEYCYDNYTSDCQVCGIRDRNYNLLSLNIADKNHRIYLARSFEIDMCDECFRKAKNGESGEWSEMFSQIYSYKRGYAQYYYVVADECTSLGLEEFGFDSLEEFYEAAKHHGKTIETRT